MIVERFSEKKEQALNDKCGSTAKGHQRMSGQNKTAVLKADGNYIEFKYALAYLLQDAETGHKNRI